MWAAPSASRLQFLLAQSTSNSSVMTAGGRIARLDVMPKKPKTMSPAELVVTDGATINPLVGVNAPLCESTGVVGLTFFRSITDPAADICDPKDQL
jgi:hypothetical protein